MTIVWDIIEAALARQFKPPRDQQWLADCLKISPQAVHQWKSKGVPAKRYRDIATHLGLTIDQLEGLAPLPWDRGWPFPDIEPERFYALAPKEKDAVQRGLLELIEDLERQRGQPLRPVESPAGEPKPAPRETPSEEQRRLAAKRRLPDLPDSTGRESGKNSKAS
jgi:hypothetical protein